MRYKQVCLKKELEVFWFQIIMKELKSFNLNPIKEMPDKESQLKNRIHSYDMNVDL